MFTEILLQRGANANFKDDMGTSVLSVAFYFGYYQIVKVLLGHSALIDASCMERAYRGFENHVQIEILDLFSKIGWVNLYLDDLRDVPSGFFVARTVDEAISILKSNSVHILSLDHDLGMDDKGNLLPTGYNLVKYICQNDLRPANKIHIHTDNVVARENMYQTLIAAQRRGFINDDIEIYHYSITTDRYPEN